MSGQPGALGAIVARSDDWMAKDVAELKRKTRQLAAAASTAAGLLPGNNLSDVANAEASLINLLKGLPDL